MDIWEKAKKSMGCRPSEIRSRLGISISEFAKIMNVPVGTMCRWLGSGEEPDVNEQIRMNELMQIYNALFSLVGARKELELTAKELSEVLAISESKVVAYESAENTEGFVPFTYKLAIYRLLEQVRKIKKRGHRVRKIGRKKEGNVALIFIAGVEDDE